MKGTTLDEYFGRIGASIMALVQIMTFDGHMDIIRALARFNSCAVPLFFVFIIGAGFGLINLLIAVMNEAMQKYANAQSMQRIKFENTWRRRAKWAGGALFNIIDVDADGRVNMAEIENVIVLSVDKHMQKSMHLHTPKRMNQI